MSLPVRTVVASKTERSSSMMAADTGPAPFLVETRKATAETLRRFRLLCIPDRTPDLFRRQWHVDLLDAVFGQRIDHGIDDHDEAAGAAGFAAALGAQRVGLRGRGMIADIDQRHVPGARQG